MEKRATPSQRGHLVLLFVSFAGLLGVLPSLATRDINWCYPYMGPDSWDWLVNGLFWSGAPIPTSFRPPGLPLIIAGLHRASALPLLPYFGFAMLALTAILLHRLVRLRHSPFVAAFAVLLFVSNGSFFGYCRYLMAEIWTLPFLVAAAIAFARARREPRWLVACGLLLAVSFLFHYAGAIVGAGYAATLLVARREALRTRWPWLAVLVSAPLPVAWWLLKRSHDAQSTTVHVIEGLVRISTEHLGYYLGVGVALVGIPAVPIYALGVVRLVRSRAGEDLAWAQSVLSPVAVLSIFFGFAYDWADKRFLYYLFPFLVAIGAEGVRALLDTARGGVRRAFAFAALSVATIWNRIPYPASSHSLLALLPGLFWDVGGDGRLSRAASVAQALSIRSFAADGFLSFEPAGGRCVHPREAAAAPRLKQILDASMPSAEPIGLVGTSADSTTYWTETNRLIFALERRVEKPGNTRFVLRQSEERDRRASARIGLFELFDLEAVAKRLDRPDGNRHRSPAKRKHRGGKTPQRRRASGQRRRPFAPSGEVGSTMGSRRR